MKILPVSIAQAKESGNPFFIELYNIYLRTGIVRICNADEQIVYNGDTYYPTPIQRGNVKTSVDNKIDNMDLKISDADNSKISALMDGFDFRGRIVEIFKIQYPESLTNTNMIVPVFRGKLDAPNYANGEFTCIVVSAFPKTKVPLRTTQYFCNNSFGDSLCTASKETRTLTIASITSKSVITLNASPSISNNFYENGLLTIGYETKMIKSNSGNTITIAYPFLGDIHVGDTVKIERNCNKTPEMCAKYNNRENYGGFIAIPSEFRIIS